MDDRIWITDKKPLWVDELSGRSLEDKIPPTQLSWKRSKFTQDYKKFRPWGKRSGGGLRKGIKERKVREGRVKIGGIGKDGVREGGGEEEKVRIEAMNGNQMNDRFNFVRHNY